MKNGRKSQHCSLEIGDYATQRLQQLLPDANSLKNSLFKVVINTSEDSDPFLGRFFNFWFKVKFRPCLTISQSFISYKEVEGGKFQILRHLLEHILPYAHLRPLFRPSLRRLFSSFWSPQRLQIFSAASQSQKEHFRKFSCR